MSVKNVKIRFNLDKENDRRAYVKVDIYFAGIGMINIPTEEVYAMMEEIRKNPEKHRLAS